MSFERPFDQISVIVAIISNEFLYRALKTDVGKAFLSMAIRQGLVGPKLELNSRIDLDSVTKGNQVNIPELEILDSQTVKSRL